MSDHDSRGSGFTWMGLKKKLTAVSSSGSGPLCANVRRQSLSFALPTRHQGSVLTGEVKRNAERGAEFVIARVPLSYRGIRIVHA